MERFRQRVNNLPPILELEAPGSWCTRAALSQGVTIAEFMAFLQVPNATDPDQALTFMGDRVRQECGLSMGAFDEAGRIFGNAMQLEARGVSLLLRTKGKKPRYRYCPKCLEEQRCPFFGIHCRLAPWWYCPVHQCMMEDRCPHCESHIELPASLVEVVAGRPEVAHLNQCLRCGRSLAAKLARVIEYRADRRLSDFEWDLIDNGRASLAALYRSEMVISGRRFRGITRMRSLVRRRLIPADEGWLARICDRLSKEEGGVGVGG